MPTLPTFDLYAELELTSAATTEEITASYRRLALIHHPDKNGNSDEATAKFQRLQAAYQTLKDDNTRRQYDSPRSSRSTSSSDHSRSSSYYERDSYYDSADELDDEYFFHFMFDFAGRGGPSFFRHYPPPPPKPTEEEKREARRKAREDEAAEEEKRKVRYAQEEAKRKAMEELKREQQEAAEMAKKQKEEAERLRQEKIWAAHNATTVEMKQKYCLHTEIWPKEQSKKKGEKIKCNECGKKRGVTGFKCPHCELVACQVCLTKFAGKRAKAGLSSKGNS